VTKRRCWHQYEVLFLLSTSFDYFHHCNFPDAWDSIKFVASKILSNVLVSNSRHFFVSSASIELDELYTKTNQIGEEDSSNERQRLRLLGIAFCPRRF